MTVYRLNTALISFPRFSDLHSKTISAAKLNPPLDDYRAILAYNQSKLCMVLFTMELHRHLGHLGVSCNAVHPGNMVSTGLTRNWWGWRLLFTLVRPFTKSKVRNLKNISLAS